MVLYHSRGFVLCLLLSLTQFSLPVVETLADFRKYKAVIWLRFPALLEQVSQERWA